jgi:DNA-binding MarR family transcriptional regulator/GNAT superfamily N-acetyltransferase
VVEGAVTGDLISDGGLLFLGSRLRRLAERLQGDVAGLTHEAGIPVQPGQFAVLGTLETASPLSVGEIALQLSLAQPTVTRALSRLAAEGLVAVVAGGRDQRVRQAAITAQGHAALMRARLMVWPRVEAAVKEAASGQGEALLLALAALEAALDERPLSRRAAAMPPPRVDILDWDRAYAPAFKAINTEWISAMFEMEDSDRQVLDHPCETLIATGGDILFASAEGVGIIGTCGLKRTGPGAFELTKMGVYTAARGLGAGRALLDAMVARARSKGARSLYLLSNRRNVAAIRLYESAGFVHSPAIMAAHGSAYARCDVAMDFPLV